MLVSGLPIRNETDHARQIGLVSLDLLDAVQTKVKIPHRPGKQLKLRIGLHSGNKRSGNTVPSDLKHPSRVFITPSTVCSSVPNVREGTGYARP